MHDRVMPIAKPHPANLLWRVANRSWLKLKRPFLRRRIQRPSLEHLDGVPLLSLPEVLNPVVFRTGAVLARTVAASPWAAPSPDSTSRALDMGTGSGIGAIFAARRGYRVVGVDLNPEAVRCARLNVLLNRLEDEVEIRQGDLFAPVEGERFALVLFNPPFFHGEPNGLFDLAWRSTDVMERFAAGLPAVLETSGRALVLLSNHGDGADMLSALQAQALVVDPIAQRRFGDETMTVYCIRLEGKRA